jgi:hypothetical protein
VTGGIALRGEAVLPLPQGPLVLRPTFAALCAAEEELGPLFALVERAAEGGLTLAEMTALFWHCRTETGLSRAELDEAATSLGLAAVTPALKRLLAQILSGR